MKKRPRVWQVGLPLACALLLCWGASCSDRPEQPAEAEKPGPAKSTSPAAQEQPPPAQPPATAAKTAMRRAHVFVTGRVQGVGFRAFTRREALVLKLTGWVKNLRDGRVAAVIEGPAEKVEALLKKIRRGPPAARVDKLDIADETHKGEFDTFQVRF